MAWDPGIRDKRVPSPVRVEIRATEPDIAHLKQCFPSFSIGGRYVVDVNGSRTMHDKRFHEFNPLRSVSIALPPKIDLFSVK